jgi:hypothetical protein
VAGSPARVGQVFQTSVGGVSHFYVLKADGMAPMSATESALVDAAGHRPRQVSPADIAAVPTSSDTSLLHRLPDLLGGRDATGGAALCLLQSIDAKGLHSSVVRETGIVAAPGSGVLIPPGTGLLAALPQSRPGSADGDIYLITEQGVKYPLADDQAVQALGYSSTAARPLPAYVLDLLRTGPRLSRVQAAVAVGGAS